MAPSTSIRISARLNRVHSGTRLIRAHGVHTASHCEQIKGRDERRGQIGPSGPSTAFATIFRPMRLRSAAKPGHGVAEGRAMGVLRGGWPPGRPPGHAAGDHPPLAKDLEIRGARVENAWERKNDRPPCQQHGEH